MHPFEAIFEHPKAESEAKQQLTAAKWSRQNHETIPSKGRVTLC